LGATVTGPRAGPTAARADGSGRSRAVCRTARQTFAVHEHSAEPRFILSAVDRSTVERGLLDKRIRGTEYSCRAVLPDPGMEHPARLVRELAPFRLALRLRQVDRRAGVRQHAHVVVLVPTGQRPREWRRCGLSIGTCRG